jgi:hypothetical protein
MPDETTISSLKARAIQLGYKRATAEGLTPAEQAELQSIQQQLQLAQLKGKAE